MLRSLKKMTIKALSIVFILSSAFNFYSIAQTAVKPAPGNKVLNDTAGYVKYMDATCFEIKGKYHYEENYNRLPVKFQGLVSQQVWNLSKNSAGISVRFSTDSPFIYVKWKLVKNTNPPNMNKIGSNGLDLYSMMNDGWQYVNSAVPSGNPSTSLLISEMDTTLKTFLLNVPISDEVVEIQLGVKRTSVISMPVRNIDKLHKPIVFYGTSITQGIGASRPGMAYPSIISRELKGECINLGFSGNGKFEASVGQVLCDIDAELYVLDCTPNSSADIIKKNTLKLVQQIRLCKPDTPILLIESIIRENSYLNQSNASKANGLQYIRAQNSELKQSYIAAIKLGIKNLYYLEGNDLIGSDHEATIDGTHLSDIGQHRIAEIVSAKIVEILHPKNKLKRR
jgi:lysophospholipase L1-like esterase